MKRFVLVIMALVMMFAVCAIAEEITEEAVETTTMYVANCGTVTVWSEPDFNSDAVTTVMWNMDVEVTGEPVENGWYYYAPVTVDGNEGYILCDDLAEEREVANLTAMCIESRGLKVHTAPSTSAPLVKKPYLRFGMIPQYAIFEIEYYIGQDWAYLTVEIKGQKEELGYACWRSFKADKQFIFECDPTVTAEWVYNLNWYEIDTWNDLRG